jgi:hypothetical protein
VITPQLNSLTSLVRLRNVALGASETVLSAHFVFCTPAKSTGNALLLPPLDRYLRHLSAFQPLGLAIVALYLGELSDKRLGACVRDTQQQDESQAHDKCQGCYRQPVRCGTQIVEDCQYDAGE